MRIPAAEHYRELSRRHKQSRLGREPSILLDNYERIFPSAAVSAEGATYKQLAAKYLEQFEKKGERKQRRRAIAEKGQETRIFIGN
jgi:hypothetical protein